MSNKLPRKISSTRKRKLTLEYMPYTEPMPQVRGKLHGYCNI